jgi:hypothetical protein
VEDLQELMSLDLPASNVDVETNISTNSVYATAVSAVDVSGATMSASNVVASNITATQFLEGLTINAESNLCWGGHSLYDPYPNDQTDWDEMLPFDADLEGMIDVSWLRKPLTAKDVLTDLWNIAETGIDVAEAIADAYQFFQGTGQEALAQATADILSEALDNLGDETSSNPKVAVSWSNIKNRPIASQSTNVGVKGDLFVNDAQSLKVISSTQFNTNSYGQVGMTTDNADTILNFGSKEGFFNSNTTRQLTASNINTSNISSGTATLTSLTTSNINTSNLTSEMGTFNQGLNVGSNQITLSNNQIYFKSGTECNMILGNNFIWNRNSAFTVRTSNTSSNFYPLFTVQSDGRVYQDYRATTTITGTTAGPTYPLYISSALTNNVVNLGMAFGTGNFNFPPSFAFWHQKNGTYGCDFHLAIRDVTNLGSAGALFPRFTVKTGGNVGVNNSNPQYNLDVNGVIYCSSNLLMNIPATIRADEMASNAGVLTIEPNAFRYIR